MHNYCSLIPQLRRACHFFISTIHFIWFSDHGNIYSFVGYTLCLNYQIKKLPTQFIIAYYDCSTHSNHMFALGRGGRGGILPKILVGGACATRFSKPWPTKGRLCLITFTLVPEVFSLSEVRMSSEASHWRLREQKKNSGTSVDYLRSICT